MDVAGSQGIVLGGDEFVHRKYERHRCDLVAGAAVTLTEVAVCTAWLSLAVTAAEQGW